MRKSSPPLKFSHDPLGPRTPAPNARVAAMTRAVQQYEGTLSYWMVAFGCPSLLKSFADARMKGFALLIQRAFEVYHEPSW